MLYVTHAIALFATVTYGLGIGNYISLYENLDCEGDLRTLTTVNAMECAIICSALSPDGKCRMAQYNKASSMCFIPKPAGVVTCYKDNSLQGVLNIRNEEFCSDTKPMSLTGIFAYRIDATIIGNSVNLNAAPLNTFKSCLNYCMTSYPFETISVQHNSAGSGQCICKSISTTMYNLLNGTFGNDVGWNIYEKVC